jgi:hypothetical protein
MSADPVFVGGTGNSGTTVVGELLGHHPRFACVPVELKFHADTEGVPGLVNGRQSLEVFVADLRARWYRYEHHSGSPRGLHRVIDRATLEAAIARFTEAYPLDPRAALEALVRELAVSATPGAEAKPSWVESSPRTVVSAPALMHVFPHARIVDMVRDGRDTAMSKMRQGLAVPDAFAALDWWARKLARAQRQTARVRDRVLTIRLEALVRDDREATYARLLSFLEIDDAPEMRAFFESRMGPEHARAGVWREGMDAREQERFDARYRELVAELRAQGVTCLGEPA